MFKNPATGQVNIGQILTVSKKKTVNLRKVKQAWNDNHKQSFFLGC